MANRWRIYRFRLLVLRVQLAIYTFTINRDAEQGERVQDRCVGLHQPQEGKNALCVDICNYIEVYNTAIYTRTSLLETLMS